MDLQKGCSRHCQPVVFTDNCMEGQPSDGEDHDPPPMLRTKPALESNEPPSIIYPNGNMKEEVELGRSHTLMCKARFPFEADVSPEVRWYINYSGKMENMTLLRMEEQHEERVTFEVLEVIRRASIKEVTPQLLNQNPTFTCIANNTHGNSNVTIKLIEKMKVKWPSLVGYPVVPLLLVAGLGMVLHVKWLEIQLIYRSHFQHGKHDKDKKEFDVLLSYVWSPPTAELEVLTISSQKGPDTDEEACLSSMDPLNTEEGNSIHRPLEVLLPHVLEDRWAYRLCLLERDVLPGGGFAAKLFPQSPANMDQRSLSIPHPAGPPAAHTGPKGLEGATQSGLDPWRQQLLEVFEESHARSESEARFTHAGPMIKLFCLQARATHEQQHQEMGFDFFPIGLLMLKPILESLRGAGGSAEDSSSSSGVRCWDVRLTAVPSPTVLQETGLVFTLSPSSCGPA
ncbi:hypothetical protein FQN60_011150 [Etheostoma spectabile]|uniref:Ig-like domain-containing protein n=1 Tax=Etheostoma spectabile TaxID=54343 RepID=A0A5J5DRB6_9PERO|nr:hypothetical protein FQN60_011150 [Etheostoma spectabile]